MKLREFRVSATDLAHFCCRKGGVVSGNERKPSAQQGIQGHLFIQQQRPQHYQREVSIKKSITTDRCHWILAGRIDGLQHENVTILEEIKTTYCSETELPDDQHQIHLAQAQLYGALICQQQNLTEVLLRITYLKLDDAHIYYREQLYSHQELEAFLNHCIAQYSNWLNHYCIFLDTRNSALQEQPFPFDDYRAGQRSLSVTLYRDIRDCNPGIYHAPTGLGKTIGLLFPALKHLAEGNIAKIWYLTAKNSGHNSVRQALAHMNSPLPLRILYLQAREKTCAGCIAADQSGCKHLTNHYDRLPAARDAFQSSSHFNEQDLLKLAQEHQLCPHQLTRDLLPWVDVVVADYNYVFDPYTRLTDPLTGSKSICLLIDEAHNLPQRARSMFSAELSVHCINQLQKAITDTDLQKRLRSIGRTLQTLLKDVDDGVTTLPSNLINTLQFTADQLNEWFAQQNWLLFPNDIFENIMTLWRFAQRATKIEAEDTILCSQQPARIQIFCTDPAPQLERISSGFHSCHYFSGSLLPINFFQRSISTQPLPSQLVLASPFPPENLLTLVAPVNTRFHNRAHSMHQIVELIQTLWQCRPGRYLMALPSYEYLRSIMTELEQYPGIPLLCQSQTSSPETHQTFHQQLQKEHYLAGVITGGLFAEGIDLNNKLDGVIIIGTCLPPPSTEIEQIKAQFDQQGQSGFDFAYRYPGINRVIQTAGRVIRSEQDRGVVLLVDDRFTQPVYRNLLPSHWQPHRVKSSIELKQALSAFAPN